MDSLGALLPYYPDQLDSYFAFEASDSIIAAVKNGSARGLLAPMLRLQERAPFGHWSPFLRNHDQTRTRTALGGTGMARSRVATVLMLTMPGVPFVYYGEEIGMTGDKPDERLRTPMQWSRGHAAGFTRGTPWERLADDSLTVTVAAQDRDPKSLLNLERRLIHLRAANAALADGRLVPLTASSDAVAAYARRDGDHVVVIVANLGATALRGVSIATNGAGALPAGRWTVRDLLGGASAAPLTVGNDGQLRGYVPLRTLAPGEGHVFELTR
jgi:glycosidase